MNRTLKSSLIGLLTLGATATVAFAPAEAAQSTSTSSNSALTSSPWAPYTAGTVTSGSFSIAPDGSVSGTLPPGYTKERPPSDPSDPSMAQRIEASPDTSNLQTFTQATATKQGLTTSAPLVATPNATGQDHVGCVTAISTIGADGLSFKGQMAGCRNGNLTIHAFLYANGVNVDNGLTINCVGTSCSVPYSTYTGAPKCRQFVNYAHGINHTTGGDDTAYQVHSPYAC